ncbi:hypothetical protein GWI33_013877 [Rhynchophorus ferrugineus]|uniref:Uncharacterized protein n=1 Tax=Rhynchophorus ferrugineus TaxID=354439 RepID=A0A834I669_RHYFE|nr:hypothetical protein GWI33_013877 [Rhynchophorus ferrugineus]
MSTLKSIWNCMFSPKLIKIYGHGPIEKLYEPQPMEKLGDQVIHSLYIIWKLVVGFGAIFVVSFCIRGLSRAQNPVYQTFLATLHRTDGDNRRDYAKYDFDFKLWPVEYDLSKTASPERVSKTSSEAVVANSTFEYLTNIPFRIIASFAIHTFGIRLVYPGSVGILQSILEGSLLSGRSRLVESYRGQRYKLKASDGNDIDSIFIDKRNASQNGETLVVCCEGNAGFYEIGIMITPIEAGYSVLGWNHPGFAGSTGMPYPENEQNAIDAVMQFAINKLGFKVENIMLFGWSIGGYTSSWAAMTYPDVKGIIIDATFDDILPLALNHMPKCWESIVKIAIREHVNLNVYEHLSQYSGPLLLIRRTDDEVICLKDNDLLSNRGNDLLIKILKQRYPCIFEPHLSLLQEYLSVSGVKQAEMLSKYNVDESVCSSLLQTYVSEFSKSYPIKIGPEFSFAESSQMALFLASKHMKDFKSSHCTNLPGEMFTKPWDIIVDSDYVFT